MRKSTADSEGHAKFKDSAKRRQDQGRKRPWSASCRLMAKRNGYEFIARQFKIRQNWPDDLHFYQVKEVSADLTETISLLSRLVAKRIHLSLLELLEDLVW